MLPQIERQLNGPSGNSVVLAILAAGNSRRFGIEDKLAALLHKKMLGLHAAEALANTTFARRFVIASKSDHPCVNRWREMGYSIVFNKQAELGQSTSVRLAVQTARGTGAKGLCICLADMPFVTSEHVHNLLKAFQQTDHSQPIASASSDRPMPPAIFPARLFCGLESLEGDQGGRMLLKKAQHIHANAPVLMDIDTPETLQKLNQQTA